MILLGESPRCTTYSTVSPYSEVMWRHLIGSLINEIRDSEIIESEHLCVFVCLESWPTLRQPWMRFFVGEDVYFFLSSC